MMVVEAISLHLQIQAAIRVVISRPMAEEANVRPIRSFRPQMHGEFDY